MDQCRVEVDRAREVWRSTGGPIEDDLSTQLEKLDAVEAQLGVERLQREAWLLEHPGALDRLAALDRETRGLDIDPDIARPDDPRPRLRPPSLGGPGLAI